MADREKKKGVPTSALVVAVIFAIIFALILIYVWIQLQDCITKARNNICPTLNTDSSNL